MNSGEQSQPAAASDATAPERPWPAELELAARLGEPLDRSASPAVPHAESLTLSSVWSMPDLDTAEAAMQDPSSGFAYRRDAHPNARSLALKLAKLHAAQHCVLTAQGMSALAAVAWSMLKPGSEVWLASDLYGKTRAMFTQGLGPWQVLSRTFNPTCSDDLHRLSNARAELIVVETISNPRVQVCDIGQIARIAQRIGAKLLVDNTFASHLLVQPLALGADLCMESLTKIVSGHSDAMVGMVCGNDAQLMGRIAGACSQYGLTSSPLDCYLTTRGLASLPLRLDAACRNALALADCLSKSSSVVQVDYPGLASHPQHQVARQQLTAFGWMLCIELEGGREAVARAIARLAPDIPFCPSLGDIQTTVSHPASTSHRSLSPSQLAELGISQGSLRISCGAEPTAWLCERFCEALA